MKAFVLGCLFIVLLQCCGIIATSCSKMLRTNNPHQCIVDIRSMIQDKDEFWFGNDYSRRCPGGPFSSLDCYNTSPVQVDSLATRIFGDMSLNYSMIDRFLTVKYTTETDKTYQGCGQTGTTSSVARTIDLDPLASRDIYHPLDTQLQPDITWDKTDGDSYTVMIYDAGSHISHGIFIYNQNVTETIKPYNSPLNPRPIPNVYAFLLFKKTGLITISEDWRRKLAVPMISSSYNLSDALEALQLEGPIAVNVIRVSADLYSVQQFVNLGILNNCAYFVSQALKEHNRRFIPTDIDLSVMMYVSFHVTSMPFGSCCKMYNYPEEENRSLNPIGNGRVRTDEVRTGLSISIQLVKRTLYPLATNFQGTLHTLLVVDPDVPSTSAGTLDKPLLHWLIINIPDGLTQNGTEIKSYIGAAPPDKSDHTYYFLMYQQTSLLSNNASDMYAGTSCAPTIAGRCLFDVGRFASENGLTLVGASWYVATNDAYARHFYGKRQNADLDQICNGVDGYSPGCPTGNGRNNYVSIGFAARIPRYDSGDNESGCSDDTPALSR